jgi:hypothetical protein
MILERPWPLMQEMASTQNNISEVLTDLNMTNSPSLAVPIPLQQKLRRLARSR